MVKPLGKKIGMGGGWRGRINTSHMAYLSQTLNNQSQNQVVVDVPITIEHVVRENKRKKKKKKKKKKKNNNNNKKT